MRGGIGTGEFRKIYGGRKRRGMKPSRSSKASGGLIRASLQQLEKLGIIEKDPNGGRRLTRKGQAEMDTQAGQCLSS
jgi:small subunit ribosomal protein S19e